MARPSWSRIVGLGCVLVLLSAWLAAPARGSEPAWLDQEWKAQFDVLSGHLARRESINRFAATVFNAASLIDKDDKDPADVVLRRTAVLLADLKGALANGGDLGAQLAALTARNAQVNRGDANARYALYLDACRLRRKIAFANPLLTFSEILFAKHNKCGPNEGVGNHMCDQFMGFKASPGGGIFVLSDIWGDAPRLRNVLANSTVADGRLKGKKLPEGGSWISPAISYDARTVYFGYTEMGQGAAWSPEKSYHIFSAGLDGGNLRQLTDGKWNEFDPCPMPNGRLMFISERRGGYGRCHGREVPVFTLHSMNDDGSDIVTVSFHESNEWQPSVNNDGMIVYTRWDYVDRGFNQAHHPWITTPDGRDARSLHGNFPPDNDPGKRPWAEMHVRAIPGSRKYVATAAPHHGQAYGTLVIFDTRVADDDQMAPVRRLTPEAVFPEGEEGGYPYHTAYQRSWPLSENYHLVTYDAHDNNHGIYLLDAFGNKELIYRDPQLACLGAIPLRAQAAPPVLPHLTLAGKPQTPGAATQPAPADATGTVTVINVYDSLKPLPANTRIVALRVMQLLPKTTPVADNPQIGYGSQKNVRAVLGTVPVESDGSAYFTAPARKPLYFQALDERGLAVQSMKSDTYLQPGDQLTCQGCHNQSLRAPTLSQPAAKALKRAPSSITPEADGSRPFNYPRLVQTVLDRQCVSCHTKSRQEGKNAIDLAGARTSYNNLRGFAFFWDGAAATSSRTTPGQFGARASRLLAVLDKGHYGLKLPAEDLRRITLWLDSNSDFYGSCENTAAQDQGQVVKLTLE